MTRRCVYCGQRHYGRKSVACPRHRAIEALDPCRDQVLREPLVPELPAMREELREAVRDNAAVPRWRATCPKCGELAKPGRRYCARCRTALYPSDEFLAKISAREREAKQTAKGSEA